MAKTMHTKMIIHTTEAMVLEIDVMVSAAAT
jgi:hypothetical protein